MYDLRKMLLIKLMSLICWHVCLMSSVCHKLAVQFTELLGSAHCHDAKLMLFSLLPVKLSLLELGFQ